MMYDRAMAVKLERLEARITANQKRLLQRAARLQGRSLSDFVVSSAQSAARRVILDCRIVELSERDSEAFAKVLIDPPPPSPRLVAAAKRFARRGSE